MPDHGDPQLFRLHFKGAGTEGHTLPAALLVRAINSVQRIVRLLDSFDRVRQSVQYQDYLSEKHLRHQSQVYLPAKHLRYQSQDYLSEKHLRYLVSRKIRNRFELFFQTPEKGSFALPVAIGRSQRYGARSTDVELKAIWNTFCQFTEAMGMVNLDRLCEIVPDSDYRELLIQDYRSALPPIDTRITLSIEDGYGRPILDGEIARACIEKLPHEVIEKVVFTFCNVRYRAEPPLRFQVNLDRDWRNRIYYIRGDFGIELFAESLQELEEALDSALDMLWEEYAQERPERLSGDARELRLALLGRIRRTE